MFNLTAFLSFATVVIFTPGPNNILSMVNGSNFGYRKTLNFILGVSTGFFILMISSAYFNLLLVDLIPKVKTLISIIGASYMLYLAAKIMGITLPKDKNKKSNTDNSDALNTYRVGLTMQFLNPKAILFSLTIMSGFVTPYYSSNLFILLFSILLAFLAFTATSSWAIFGSAFNKILSKYDKAFNITMSLLLVYCAYSLF